MVFMGFPVGFLWAFPLVCLSSISAVFEIKEVYFIYSKDLSLCNIFYVDQEKLKRSNSFYEATFLL